MSMFLQSLLMIQVKSQTLKEAEPQVLKTVSTAQNQSTTVGTTDQVRTIFLPP